MNLIIGMLSSHSLPRRQAARRDRGEALPDLTNGSVLAILLAAMLSGCATTGPKAYPYFDRLAIEALPPAPVEESAAVMAGGTALSAEDAERVTSYLENLQRTHDLGEELVAAV